MQVKQLIKNVYYSTILSCNSDPRDTDHLGRRQTAKDSLLLPIFAELLLSFMNE